ncbi:PilC/PilY family type IV pilus protein [Noviherbaspirillum sp. 1P10PC]|uniref:PilC/PilY family type IV pilus protein n=1 Tax=Noviherbaspirillum sp. 1P10PC TaxID=3132292 RepID=UPI0039A148DF
MTIHSHRLPTKLFLAFVTLTCAAQAGAAVIDISSEPLNTYSAPSSTDVKPNLMFILDNSGSMAWEHMPDNSADAGSAVPFTYGYYGYRSSQCNGLYYNPATVYRVPVKADGVTYYPNASFTAALPDGFKVASSTNVAVDLSSNFRAETDTAGAAAYYFTYSGTQTTEALKNYYSSTSTFSKECSSTNGASPGVGVFTKVVVSASERQNFANWYSYYRTRMLMMKTAAGLAFKNIDQRFRVGFMAINNVAGSADFLQIDDFTPATKSSWYAALYASVPSGSTPLRNALSDAGRLYAGKLTTRNGVTNIADPLQYSCQQNYAILSTDGFWNTGSGYKLDGTTAVGNQDVGQPRPYFDGGSAQVQVRTSTLQSQSVTPQQQRRTSNLQARTTVTATAPSIQTRTSTDRGSTWSAWSNVDSCAPDSSGASQRQCQVPKSTSSDSGSTWTAWSYVSACNADSSGTSQTRCSGSVSIKSAWANVASCTVSSSTECQYSSWSAYSAATSSCVAQPKSTGSPFTVGIASECLSAAPLLGAWTPASSCTAVPEQTNCQYTPWSNWANANACTPVAQSSSPSYTVQTARQCQVTSLSGGTSDTLADVAAYYYNTDLRSSVSADGTGTCTGPIIPPATTPNNLCTDNVPSNGLDVATTQHMTTFTLGLGVRGKMVYSPTYATDTSGDFKAIATGATANSSSGICSWQANGTTCNWPTPGVNSSGDGKIENVDDLWHAAVNGRGAYFSASNPESLSSGLTSALQTIINTPRPGTAAAAASSNPNVSSSDNYVFSSSYKSVEWYGELIRQQISETGLLGAQNWSAMKLLDCATTPWKALTSYSAGDVYSQANRCYSVTTGYVSGTTFDSSSSGRDMSNTVVMNVDEAASIPVPTTPLASRAIYTKGAAGLIPFQWSNLVTEGLQSNFTAPALTYVAGNNGTESTGLSQFCVSGTTCLNTAAQSNTTVATGGAAGEALVNFLRGDRSQEGIFFRKRLHVLGDIVSSEARYVQAPLFNYTDSNYNEFKTAMAARSGTAYVGANDGMLHAFDAATGQERWAYIPSMVLPNLYKLADKNYATRHQYFVDNTPETGDICPLAPGATCTAAQWKTILIGGLNRGGKGYYALDITDPATPKLLWEFTAGGDLGYSYGNPKITKLKNGTWVVLLGAGYNNRDGLGRLYVLNANTGAPISAIESISTGVGSPDSPSGIARISAHAISPMTNNTTVAAYGGDMFGNLWRFDINGDIGAAGYDAQLLASFKDANGKAQPITVKLLEATISGKPVIFAGTGRYLGTSDVADKSPQSFYAVMDRLNDRTYLNPRADGSGFVRQTLVDGTCPAGTSASVCSPTQAIRTISSNPVDWSTNNGWYIDFLSSGERSVTDPSLGLGTLLFTTVTPQSSSVSACGGTDTGPSSSFVYALDYMTGSSVDGANRVGAMSLGSGMVTRPVMIKQSNGTVRALIRTSSVASGGTDLGGTVVITPPIKPPSNSLTHRVSWRVLSSDR